MRDLVGAETINWGVVATGKIAGQFARAFSNLDDGSVLAAVGSRREETAAAFAAEHSIATAHPRYEDLAADPSVDVVYIASLQPSHADDAILFLDAGKHVLVEKPMALTESEARQMVDASDRAGVRLMVGQSTRFGATFQKAKELVTGGAVGEGLNVARHSIFWIERLST